jgi:hypothetical protein
MLMHVIKNPLLITLTHGYFNLTVFLLHTDQVRGLKRLTHFGISEVLGTQKGLFMERAVQEYKMVLKVVKL